MERRDFLQNLGLGLTAAWALGPLSWSRPAAAGNERGLSIALLADAHLKDGDPARPEARLLRRAVAEILALNPSPDLVLFAGDLAHDGHPYALALGKEILAGLFTPVLLVRGEGDGCGDEGAGFRRLFGEAAFSHTYRGVNLLGLDTRLSGPKGEFTLGAAGQRFGRQELSRLDPKLPLVVLSHAPLAPIFRPWGQWTADGEAILSLLSRFPQVLCLHGHVHLSSGKEMAWGRGEFEGRAGDSLSPGPLLNPHFSLPATAWPLPAALMGTPRRLQPGLAPCGCGWALLSLTGKAWKLAPRVWQA